MCVSFLREPTSCENIAIKRTEIRFPGAEWSVTSCPNIFFPPARRRAAKHARGGGGGADLQGRRSIFRMGEGKTPGGGVLP